MMRRSLHLFAAALACGSVAACGGGDTTTSSGDTTTATGTTGSTTDPPSPCEPGGNADVLKPPAIHTPRWAYEPWISKDISTGPDTYDFVDGFQSRDIPVGAVVLDSPWETHYNTFIPNPSRYPDFPKMVGDMHQRGVRVVLWITALVNSTSFDLEPGGDAYVGPSPNAELGNQCGFFINEGEEYNWWKGKGASVDFFHTEAMNWWHKQQDGVLDAGVDGWKLDFGDSYVTGDVVNTFAGQVSHQEYSEAYYRDFLAYGADRRGEDFVTMVRGWDESYNLKGRFHARPEHAPVVWMGDNRRDWLGVVDVLDSTFRSAAAGYVMVGSDIGGYLDKDDKNLLGDSIPLDPVVFAKWTALGALSPFMQLHGRANLTPWTFPEKATEITDVYRYWSKLHHELVPFFYSLGVEAYGGAGGIVRPIGAEASWPGDYRYHLGDAFLVAPLLDGTGKRDVALPAGSRWLDWWTPGGDYVDGGQTLAAYDASELLRYPLFVREGAVVPAEVADPETGLGNAASAGKLTLLVYPGPATTELKLHETDGTVTTITASQKGVAGFVVSVSKALRDTLVRVRVEAAPAKVTVGGAAAPALADRAAFDAAKAGFFHDAGTRSAWIHVPAGAGPVTVEGS